MLSVVVLGPVEVSRNGEPLGLPAGKTRDLLVRLALEVGTYVRADALLDELWDEPAGRNTLQSKVSQLRRALGERELVAAAYDGYALLVSPDSVDVVRVTDLAARASAARAARDPAAALALATDGLALFRGEVLPGAADWALPHRTRLEEVRLGLLEDALAARVELGSGADVVAELEALVAEHPWREGLWVALITALYRAGRQAEALAAYRRVRATLVEDLGIEPGPALRAVEQQVLQQELEVPPAAAAPPNNLPPPGTPLVGRDHDVAAVAGLLAERRLVTVLGQAGVGKTRLAVEVAREVTPPGGAWLVRLDAVDDTADLTRVAAETLHAPMTGLVERLSGARTLLVLDNCEHLWQSAGALARTLLDAVPGLRVLATSQTSLGLADERGYPLSLLDQADSVQLFAQRAREQRASFELDERTAEDVDAVCGALEGLPLAIELAASRVRSMSVRDISRRLDDRFAVLSDPTSQGPVRQRTLAGAIGWSYDLLFPDDQRALWALSWFVGGAPLEAVEHVLAALGVPRGAVLDTIGRLVDRSLVDLEEADGEARYRLLDSIRTYAAGRLEEAGLTEVALRAMVEWYADRAAWCDERVRGPEQAACLAFARSERANVDLALGWAAENDPRLGVAIATGLGWTWVVLGDGTAGAARLRGTVTAATAPRARAEALLLAGWLEASAGDVALAARDLDAASVAATATGNDVLIADVARHRAFLAIQQGRPDLVLAEAAAALEVYRPRALAWREAGCLLLAAYGSLMTGDTATATLSATEALALLEPIGDAWGIVHGEAMLGGIAQAEHRFGDAVRALARAADESAAQGFPGQAALHRATLARVLQRLGDPAAPETYARAIQDAVAGGDGRLAATARVQLARLLHGAGDVAGARPLLEENQRWFAGAGGGDFALLTAATLGSVRDDPAALRDVLAAAQAGHDVVAQVIALDALARLAEADEAVGLLAEADALATGLGHALDEADRYDAAIARAATR